jgi:hypothetical protein
MSFEDVLVNESSFTRSSTSIDSITILNFEDSVSSFGS